MELTIIPTKNNGHLLQIDDARICYRNFRGEGSTYNNDGDRNFCLIIPNEEIAETLQENKNEFGAGWNVKIKPPKEDGEEPFMYMKVTVKFTERSQPNVYMVSNGNQIKLNEKTIGMLDDIRISKVDLDIRSYDGESRFGPHRTAYLQSIKVYQDLSGDRFAPSVHDDFDEEY